jgi:hypothetical protein
VNRIAYLSLRALGDLVSLAIPAACLWATWRLAGVAHDSLHIAGAPVPSVDWLNALMVDPWLSERAMHWGIAWISAVGAVGTGWMSVLGVRAAYLTALRWLHPGP